MIGFLNNVHSYVNMLEFMQHVVPHYKYELVILNKIFGIPSMVKLFACGEIEGEAQL